MDPSDNHEPSETSPAVACLKHYARILHRRIQQGEPQAVRVLRGLREFADPDAAQWPEAVQRKHCLTAAALQLGFRSWPHALEVLEGDAEDFGTLLCPPTCHGHYNIWSAHYAEARGIREEHGGYLLAFKRQFLIVDRNYVESMGLDPDDPDWGRIGRDWVKPKDRKARERLYEKLVHNTLVQSTLSNATNA
jgi:hypothetical protein